MAQILNIEGNNYIGIYQKNICHLEVTEDRFGLIVLEAHPPSSPIPTLEDSLYPYYWELQYNLFAYSDGKDVWAGYKCDHLTKLKRSQWRFVQDHLIPRDKDGNAVDEDGSVINGKVGVPEGE